MFPASANSCRATTRSVGMVSARPARRPSRLSTSSTTRWMNAALADPKANARLADLGVEPMPLTIGRIRKIHRRRDRQVGQGDQVCRHQGAILRRCSATGTHCGDLPMLIGHQKARGPLAAKKSCGLPTRPVENSPARPPRQSPAAGAQRHGGIGSEWKQAPSEAFKIHHGGVDMRYCPSDRRGDEHHHEHM
jgi:hypothetical protein